MRLSEKEMSSVQSFRELGATLAREGRQRDAQLANMYALQVINRAAIELIESGDIHEKTAGKYEEFIYSDVSRDLLTLDPDRQLFDLRLNLVRGTPLTNDILQVLKKHLEGK